MTILLSIFQGGPRIDIKEADARRVFINELTNIHPEIGLWAASELAVGLSLDMVKVQLAAVVNLAQADRSSLYRRIQQAWHTHTAELNKTGEIHPWNAPLHLQDIENEGRKLDAELGAAFKEPLQMYQDGLISAIELLDKMLEAASIRA